MAFSVSPSCGAEVAPSKDSDVLSEHTCPPSGITDNREIGLWLDFVQILSTPKLTAPKAAFFFLALIWDRLLLPFAPAPVFNIFWTPVSVVQTASVPRRNTHPVPGLRAGEPAWASEPQAAASGFFSPLCPGMLCLKAAEVVLRGCINSVTLSSPSWLKILPEDPGYVNKPHMVAHNHP